MKKVLLSALVLLTAAMGTQAKSWKIGPNSVNGMDFADINAAMADSKVSAGDTLFLDQYFSTKVKQSVTKQVVIIGTGYDTTLTDEKVVATLTDSLVLMVDNIQVKSVMLSNVKFYADECTLDRCYTKSIEIGTVPKGNGLNHIYSCYITGRVGNEVIATSSVSTSGTVTYTYAKAQLDIQNCIIQCSMRTSGSSAGTGNSLVCNLTKSIINNNCFNNTNSSSSYYSYCLFDIIESQITNNIMYSSDNPLTSDVIASGSGNTIEHNILRQSVPANFPSNVYNSNPLSLFNQTGSYSDWYTLKTNVTDNFALTYATDGGQVGCHGGMFGNPSGGRPQFIPYFTKVVVGQRAENGKLPVSLEIKIQDK